MFLATFHCSQRHSFGTHLVKILQLLDAISRVACLGFEKSYRESIVLMTRSYLDKVKALGASENNTLPSEATAEHTEVCDELCKKLVLYVYLMKCDFDFFSMFHANYVKQFLDSSCRLSACCLQPHKHKTQV